MRPGRRTAAITAVAALGVAGSALLAVGVAPDGRSAAGEPAQPTLPPEGTVLPTPSSDVHVAVPALGLDLPVLPLTPSGGVINPPLLTAAYWIDSYGDPVGDAAQADNTVYIAAHATGTGEYGFDALVDAEADDEGLRAGDVVEVSTPEGTVDYTVERTQRYDKDELAGAADIWAAVPGRLVLITCFQRAGQASTENLVVVAHA
ncbi:class F sortase [Geodermatophilus nigrescens]